MRIACRALIFHLIAVSAVPILSYAADNAATQALHQLFDSEWKYQMAHDPVTASQLGDRRWNDKWQGLSLSAVQESYQHARKVQGQLKTIDRTHLSSEEQLSYAVFNYNLSDYLQGKQYKWYLVRTNTFEGIQTVGGAVNSLRFETVKDYDDWLGRMRNFPAYMDQNIGLMRQGIKNHIVLPKVIGEKVLTQLDGMDWRDPTKHGFYKPFKPMPPSFSDADRQRLTAAASDVFRPGYFYINTYKPETRPEYEITSLILHEAIPGHTFQGGIAIELKGIPQFRRYGGYSAYAEGWALYYESLGDELGLYDDPYVRFGRQSNEMWRAVRLVDTGMHYKHWTRQQAIDYFLAHVTTTEYNATSEVDRYISWPGQALVYKIGELKIKELRQRAEKELRSDFDVRALHDVVLLDGPLPLTVLEKQVSIWIEKKEAEGRKSAQAPKQDKPHV